MVKYINFAFHHVFELLNAHIWSNMQQIYYGHNSRRSPYIIVTDMMYLLVNWTDVTSTESQPGRAGPESVFFLNFDHIFAACLTIYGHSVAQIHGEMQNLYI